MGKMSRVKGAKGEREIAKILRESGLDPNAERGQQRKGGPESPDVKTCLPIHFEVKRTEQPKLYKAYAQAQDESAQVSIPVVVHRKNGEKWMAFLSLEHLIKIIREGL